MMKTKWMLVSLLVAVAASCSFAQDPSAQSIWDHDTAAAPTTEGLRLARSMNQAPAAPAQAASPAPIRYLVSVLCNTEGPVYDGSLQVMQSSDFTCDPDNGGKDSIGIQLKVPFVLNFNSLSYSSLPFDMFFKGLHAI